MGDETEAAWAELALPGMCLPGDRLAEAGHTLTKILVGLSDATEAQFRRTKAQHKRIGDYTKVVGLVNTHEPDAGSRLRQSAHDVRIITGDSLAMAESAQRMISDYRLRLARLVEQSPALQPDEDATDPVPPSSDGDEAHDLSDVAGELIIALNALSELTEDHSKSLLKTRKHLAEQAAVVASTDTSTVEAAAVLRSCAAASQHIAADANLLCDVSQRLTAAQRAVIGQIALSRRLDTRQREGSRHGW